jgi:hypothetical protein
MRLRTGLLGLLVGGSMTLAGVAMAASVDTLLVEGFDPEANTLVFGVSEVGDDSIDCTVSGSGFTYAIDATGNVTTLTKDGLAPSFNLAGVDQPYGQTSGVCDLAAVDVTGPAGQVNHGQVVSSFVHALKEQLRESGIRGGIGCLVHFISRSAYGKGDQQEGPSDVEPAVVVSSTVDLISHETTCHNGGGSDEDDENTHGNGNGNGNGNGHSNGHGNPHTTGNSNGHGNGHNG